MSTPLILDDRQRAMLLEMGVRVWLPGTAFAKVAAEAAKPHIAPIPAAPANFTQPPPTLQSPTPVPAPAPRPAPVARGVPASAPALRSAPPAGGLDWAGLASAAAACEACGLCAGRKNATLQAAAQPQANWMVVGDPPDEDEDRAARPFVEAPGLLLDNMLKAVGASRSATTGDSAHAAYATNVVKCRPPHGRNPQPADLAQCARFLQNEIALVRPKVILAMGRFAIQTLLSEHGALATQPLGKLRGSVYHYCGVPVVVTYHPQLLLRNSADKAKAWADLCLAMDAIAAPPSPAA
jgi:uracil-DNA glycosylase family 4